MVERFLSQTSFVSQEDYRKNLHIRVPENFNFGYDVVDAYAAEQPGKEALLWTDDQGAEIRFTFADIKRESSDGTFTMWQAPALLLGVVLLAWAWVNYLRLDGVTIHHLGEEFKDMGKKKKFHSTKSIVDFADERIVSFEELEPEERTYCSMLSNLILGGALLIIGLIAGAV